MVRKGWQLEHKVKDDTVSAVRKQRVDRTMGQVGKPQGFACSGL